jgi:hypothetical protein
MFSSAVAQLLQLAQPTRVLCCAELSCSSCCFRFAKLILLSCRYNTVMKLVFLGTSCGIVYYMRYHRIIRLTYDKDQDTFRHWMLIAPSALLAVITAHPRSFMEVRIAANLGAVGLTHAAVWTVSCQHSLQEHDPAHKTAQPQLACSGHQQQPMCS